MGDGVDIDEVSYLKPGNDVTTFDIDGVKTGVAICYDGFHQEFINLYGKLGKIDVIVILTLLHPNNKFFFVNC